MPNYENKNKNSFYTWFNFDYQNFMIEVLQKLEPIFIKSKTVMYNELDDVNEVTFIQQGQYDVGYEINKQVHLKMRFPNKTVIGQFEVCFDKRILFIFKSFHDCKGYIIRKQNFRDLENEHFMLYQGLKNKALFNYINKIRRPLLSMKQQDIEHYDMRADYKQVLALRNYDENEMQDLVDREMVRQNHKMDSEETIQMKEIERRINVYQRFLTNILIKCDQTQAVYEYASKENETLLEENENLRKMAEEQGINVQALFDEQLTKVLKQMDKSGSKKVK